LFVKKRKEKERSKICFWICSVVSHIRKSLEKKKSEIFKS